MLADGSFLFPRGWDSGWPFTDATTPRFAAFVVNKDFPSSPTGLVGGVSYVAENVPVPDEIFTGAYTWTFIDRSACTDVSQPCAGASWIPPHPPIDPNTPGTCPAPPSLPLELARYCAGCDPAVNPVEVVPRATLERLAGVASGALTLAAAATPSPSTSAPASPTASTSASAPPSASPVSTSAPAELAAPQQNPSASPSPSASASASTSAPAPTPALTPSASSSSTSSAYLGPRSSSGAGATALGVLSALAAAAALGAALLA